MAKSKKDECPCRYCKDERHVGCHAECPKWEKWEKMKKKRYLTIINSKKNDAWCSYRSKAMEKNHRKYQKLKKKGMQYEKSYTK